MALERAGGPEGYEKRIWKLMAFLGRYGNQSVSEMMHLTMREIGALAESVAELLKEENKPPPGAGAGA